MISLEKKSTNGKWNKIITCKVDKTPWKLHTLYVMSCLRETLENFLALGYIWNKPNAQSPEAKTVKEFKLY